MNRVRTRRSSLRSRAGLSVRPVIFGTVGLVLVLAIGWVVFPRWSWSTAEGGPTMVPVDRSEFIHEITENGDVESASNVEIRCEVQAMGSAGTTILWIIPEGTYVKPGDKLVDLDKSALEDNKVQQQIVCANSKAAEIQAENDLKSAEIALKEYKEGTFIQDRTTIVNEGLVAKENAQRARDYAQYSARLAAKGFVTKLQLEADLFAVTKAEQDLKLAENKLQVLEAYTSKKMENQLVAAIKTCDAKLAAAKNSHQLDQQKLELIETQIEKCVIKAPEAGQVVYASQADSHGANQIIIEEGATVRERQVIIRLPDPKRMQVKAKINEAKVSQVVEGMPASLRVDAFSDVEMKGSVKKVSEYPAPTSWFNSRVKEYETIVSIDNPPPALRPGLTAEVKIRVSQQKDVLQVPCQAVLEHGGRHYCVLRDGDKWRAQAVEIGQTNDKFIVIRDGLQARQQVVLNSAAYRDQVILPELLPESQRKPTGPAGTSSGEALAQGKEAAAKPGAAAVAKANPAIAEVKLEVASAQPKPEDTAKRGSGERSSQMFEMLDKNKDGKLQRDELPENVRAVFSVADANHDGVLDRSEAMAAMKQLRGPRGGDRQAGGDRPRVGERPRSGDRASGGPT